MTIVLDAWAVVAHLKGEPMTEDLDGLLASGDSVISEINLGEVVYTLTRSHGENVALDRVRDMRREIRSEAPDWALTLDAARLKGARPISYADAFAVATARRYEAALYTGDPEIIALSDLVKVVDLR